MHKLPPRALEYLNAIARYKTLRKAAARLNVNPSAVSRTNKNENMKTGPSINKKRYEVRNG